MKLKFPFDNIVGHTRAARQMHWVVTDQPSLRLGQPGLVGVANLHEEDSESVALIDGPDTDRLITRLRLERAVSMPSQWQVIRDIGGVPPQTRVIASGVCEHIPRDMHYSAITHPLRALRALTTDAHGAVMQIRNSATEEWVSM